MSYIYKEKIEIWEWYEAKSVTSTNDEVINLVKNDTPVVLSAVNQTKGRGRRGHIWQEQEGNLYLTLTLKLSPKELSQHVCIIGLSLAKTVLSLSPQSDVKIKWPNDVFLNNKKISGILFENIKENLWAIGVGVNIVSAPELKNAPYQAGSLKENEIILDRTDFLRYFLKKFAKDLLLYQKEGFSFLKEEWLSLAMNLDKKITIKNEKTDKSGIFLTLDDDAYLVLKTDKGEERIVAGDLFI